MKNKLFGVAALMLTSLPLFLCGCGDDDNNGGDPEITDVPVVLTGKTFSFDPKDTGTMWEKGKKIGVYMMEEDGKTIVDPYQNIQYQSIVSPEGYFAPVNNDDVIYFDQNGGKSNLIAYYPYKADLKEKKDLLTVDVSNQSSASALDILYSANCKGANKDNNKVEMQLRPVLSEITFTLEAGEGVTEEYLEEAVVTLKGMSTKADFNVISGQFENYSEVKDITMIHKEAKLDTALVIASPSVESYMVHVLLPKMNREYTWELKEKLSELKQGICYNCTGTVGLEDMDVEMTEEPIGDWENGGSSSEGSTWENWIERTIDELPTGVIEGSPTDGFNDFESGTWLFNVKDVKGKEGEAKAIYDEVLSRNVIYCKIKDQKSWYGTYIAYKMNNPDIKREIYSLKFKAKGTKDQTLRCYIRAFGGEFFISTENSPTSVKGHNDTKLTENYPEDDIELTFDFSKKVKAPGTSYDPTSQNNGGYGDTSDPALSNFFIVFLPTSANTEFYLDDVRLELKKN